MSEFITPPTTGAGSKGRSAHLLLVDDEPNNLELLEAMLSTTGYKTTSVENGREALDLLLTYPDRFDVVLLDRMMPEMDGMAVLAHMKADDRLRHVPVILQTAAGNSLQIGEGLSAGAHYYLVKPFDRSQLLPIVNGAVASYQLMRELRTKLQLANPFGLILSGRFCLRTLDEARELATWLARATSDPSPVAFGLQELLTNAVEHGNLELGYEGKRQAINQGRLDEELERRARDPELSQRQVLVEVERDDTNVIFSIRDEGRGFDIQRFAKLDPARLTDPNGRGIMIARDLSFDDVSYQEPGNVVRARVALRRTRD